MAEYQEELVDTTLEDKFAKNLIRFVMLEYMTGLHWTPTGIFEEKDTDSPFTKQFENAIKRKLEDCGHEYHEFYDFYFPNKEDVEENHYAICKIKKDQFVQSVFTKNEFIKFCANLAQFAGLSYLYGAQSAPYESYILLVTAIRELKRFGRISDDFWDETKNWFGESKEKAAEKK